MTQHTGKGHVPGERLRELPLSGATGQTREPGYERIAQAIEDVCDAAEMDIDAYRNSVGIEKPYLALARALDKAGLIDWTAFDERPPDTVQAPTAEIAGWDGAA